MCHKLGPKDNQKNTLNNYFLNSTSRSFPNSWLIIGHLTRLTRRVLLVEQELPTLPEHLILPPVFIGVHVTRYLVLCVSFVDRCLSFSPFWSAMVLSVLLRFTDSDYPFGIFKLFLCLFNDILSKHIELFTFGAQEFTIGFEWGSCCSLCSNYMTSRF